MELNKEYYELLATIIDFGARRRAGEKGYIYRPRKEYDRGCCHRQSTRQSHGYYPGHLHRIRGKEWGWLVPSQLSYSDIEQAIWTIHHYKITVPQVIVAIKMSDMYQSIMPPNTFRIGNLTYSIGTQRPSAEQWHQWIVAIQTGEYDGSNQQIVDSISSLG